jgi:hypothetical protein
MFQGVNLNPFAVREATPWKTEVALLMLFVSAGLFAGVYTGFRILLHDPEVHVNKLRRRSTIRYNTEEGEKWMQHLERMKALPLNPVPGLERDQPNEKK